MKKISFYKMPIGGDIEFLFTKNGKVVESKKVIGSGIDCGRSSRVITDGVQGEFTPAASTCRESFAGNILSCIRSVEDKEAMFASSVDLDQQTFDGISDESKVFGCKPSFDAYLGKETKIAVDGKDTKQRTCGGHIHIGNLGITVRYNPKERKLSPQCAKCADVNLCGEYTSDKTYIINSLDKEISIHDLNENTSFIKDDVFKLLVEKHLKDIDPSKDEISLEFNSLTVALRNPKVTIPLMDLFCGIPSVLIDRSKDAKIRRMLYGKAGDFRKPNYGLEYRSLSNFWIKSPYLVSLFTGLARHAVLFSAASVDSPEILDALYSVVSKKEIADAINENDFEKAKEIFNKTYKFLIGSAPGGDTYSYPIYDKQTVAFFKWFVINFDKFEKDIFKSWRKYGTNGWRTFMSNTSFDLSDIDKKFESFNPEN